MSDPNNTFFFTFTCTTQYPWVLANPDLSQAMAPSKQKRTHTVFRASSAHRSTSTSKPRFVRERVKRGELLIGALAEPRNALPRIPERRLDSIGKISDTSNKLQLYQSVRHCSKTYGAKSLLQRTVKPTGTSYQYSRKSWSIVYFLSY